MTPNGHGIVADKAMHRSLKPNHVSSILTGPTQQFEGGSLQAGDFFDVMNEEVHPIFWPYRLK